MTVEILVNASAPDRATALATMAALGIADVSSGEPVPLVEVHIAEVPPREGQTRSLWNFWYHGNSACSLLKPEPEGGWQPSDGLFQRTKILEMVDQRTGIQMQWVPFSGPDGEPAGYETPDGVRLFDPALIASPNLVKQ